MAGDVLRALLSHEQSLSRAISDWLTDQTRDSLVESSTRFTVQAIGGYVVVQMFLRGVVLVVSLWRATPDPYSLLLLAIQAAIMLYVATGIGTITKQLSDIRTMMKTRHTSVTGDPTSTTEPTNEFEQEGQE